MFQFNRGNAFVYKFFHLIRIWRNGGYMKVDDRFNRFSRKCDGVRPTISRQRMAFLVRKGYATTRLFFGRHLYVVLTPYGVDRLFGRA